MDISLHMDFISFISEELDLKKNQVAATISLLQEGNTVPFIARYRKEATGNFDETVIRNIQDRLGYLVELEERKKTILSSIESQGKLDPQLRSQIELCYVKTELEDLYLPYKPKRKTRASIAREKGLEPLAARILEQPLSGNPEKEAEDFVSIEKGVDDVKTALSLARDIVAEWISEKIQVRTFLRESFKNDGMIVSKENTGHKDTEGKYSQYYDFKEKASKIPSHRFLAIQRGEKENVLHVDIDVDVERLFEQMKPLVGLKKASPFAKQMEQALQDAYKRLLAPSIETDIRVELKMQSDRQAVDVFALNLHNLLMAPPLGSKTVIGIDPGIRTGCKCAAIDETGKFIETATIFLATGEKALDQAAMTLKAMIKRVNPYAICIGNGTYGRETESFVKRFLKDNGLKEIIVVTVSESGASVYSASDIAREEFPDLDLTIRGAISIARRLQDPLAELVKVDPKSIGVGQYQHDVYQPLLQESLKNVVISSVNQVGVDLNTASASLLTYVSGIGPSLADKIIKHRQDKGAFTNRKELLDVSGLGPRVFEQAAGFLRIRNGKNPLDASAVHPERYPLVQLIAFDQGVDIAELIQNQKAIDQIPIKKYVSDSVGLPTLTDIIAELKKPGLDPRKSFEPPLFRDDIHSIKDLNQGMILEGIVTNVTAFGAFVDIGVHQDGLVHVSEITDRFIKDPSEVLKVGDKIKVMVLQVEVERKRISLSAKLKMTPKPSKPDVKQQFNSSSPFSSL